MAGEKVTWRTTLMIGGPLAVLGIVILVAASHFTTPRGREVGQIDLMATTAAPVDVDAGGQPIRFSIDIVANVGNSEIHDLAESGRLEVVAEGAGAEPVTATCATYGGSSHDSSPSRSAGPRYLKGCELECVLLGVTKGKVRAKVTWPSRRPDTAILHVRVGDDR